MFLVFFCLLLPVLLVCYVVHTHNFIRQLLFTWTIPGPPAYPIIGNGMLFLGKSAVENFQAICQAVCDYGDFCRIWVGPDLNILMSNPKDVEVLLSSPKYIEKSGEYKFIRKWLNEGLLISDASKWFKRRKILTPAFHFQILQQFVETFDRQGDQLIRNLSQFRVDEKVEIYPIVTLYALDVICESAMGTTLNAQTNSNSAYVHAVKQMAHVIHLRMLDILLRVDSMFAFTELAQKERDALKILHGFTDKIICERRKLISDANSKIDADDFDDIGLKRKKAFLDILLQSTIDGKPLTNLEIREEVDTFMFEGHDTTTSGITFCLYNIAKYPAVQAKCIEEMHTILGSDRLKRTSFAELNELHYLELVIKESLRLFPSVPLIGRTLQETAVINGRTIPAKTNVIVPIYSMGRKADLFPDPETFRPERFDVETTAEKMNPFMYIPFSAGPRNCIGQKFAMLELKSVLAKVLRHFEISLNTDSIVEPALTAELILVPESKIHFHLAPRL